MAANSSWPLTTGITWKARIRPQVDFRLYFYDDYTKPLLPDDRMRGLSAQRDSSAAAHTP